MLVGVDRRRHYNDESRINWSSGKKYFTAYFDKSSPAGSREASAQFECWDWYLVCSTGGLQKKCQTGQSEHHHGQWFIVFCSLIGRSTNVWQDAKNIALLPKPFEGLSWLQISDAVNSLITVAKLTERLDIKIKLDIVELIIGYSKIWEHELENLNKYLCAIQEAYAADENGHWCCEPVKQFVYERKSWYPPGWILCTSSLRVSYLNAQRVWVDLWTLLNIKCISVETRKITFKICIHHWFFGTIYCTSFHTKISTCECSVPIENDLWRTDLKLESWDCRGGLLARTYQSS